MVCFSQRELEGGAGVGMKDRLARWWSHDGKGGYRGG